MASRSRLPMFLGVAALILHQVGAATFQSCDRGDVNATVCPYYWPTLPVTEYRLCTCCLLVKVVAVVDTGCEHTSLPHLAPPSVKAWNRFSWTGAE